MKASAFVPGHITGFFKPVEHHELSKMGSMGCGVVLNRGVYTSAEVMDADANDVHVFLDGDEVDFPISADVAWELLRKAGSKSEARIYHQVEVPIGQGFGASAAGSLGTALALSRALDLPMTLNQCGAIAHVSEVRNATGLGDVIAECTGGMVLRLAPGAPGIGAVDKIPCSESLNVVAWVVGGPLSTKQVLRDESKMKKIQAVAEKCIGAFMKRPTPESFLRISKQFAMESGLMSADIARAVKVLEEKGIVGSMIMLGNSVFTLADDPEEVKDALDYDCIVAEIDAVGARLI